MACSSGQAVFHLDNGSILVNKGPVEWMSPDSTATCKRCSASVFPGPSRCRGPTGGEALEDAMQPWFWTTVPEVSMSPPRSTPCWPSRRTLASRRPHPRTVDEGLDEVSRRARIGPDVPRPHTTRRACLQAPDAYLQWLLDHPSSYSAGSRKEPTGRSVRHQPQAPHRPWGCRQACSCPPRPQHRAGRQGRPQAEGRRQVRKMARSSAGIAGA